MKEKEGAKEDSSVMVSRLGEDRSDEFRESGNIKPDEETPGEGNSCGPTAVWQG
jgi:hypothetical protein